MSPIAFQRPSIVLIARALRFALSFEKAISIEIGAVGRQEQHPCTARLDGGFGFWALVGGESVEDDDIARRLVPEILSSQLHPICHNGADLGQAKVERSDGRRAYLTQTERRCPGGISG